MLWHLAMQFSFSLESMYWYIGIYVVIHSLPFYTRLQLCFSMFSGILEKDNVSPKIK